MRHSPFWSFCIPVLLMVTLAPAGLAQDGTACPVSATEDLLPEVIAPMTGAEPLWLAGLGDGAWQSLDYLVKSAWVIAGGHRSGPFRVRGRRLDGDGTMRFQVGMDGQQSEEGFVADLARHTVRPGGASLKVMEDYTFFLMYLIFPSPGCWELTAHFDGTEHRIVVEQVSRKAR